MDIIFKVVKFALKSLVLYILLALHIVTVVEPPVATTSPRRPVFYLLKVSKSNHYI